MTYPESEMPPGACPTVQETRELLILGKRTMKTYTGGAAENHRLHPREALDIADSARADGRLTYSINRVAAQLIRYGTINCPESYPEIVGVLENVANNFFQERKQKPMAARQPRLSVTLRQLFTMEFVVTGNGSGFIERDGDTYL